MHLQSRCLGEDYPLTEGVTRIGRHKKCDIVLSSDSVSKIHVEISVTGNIVQIRDADSHNGTTLNDRSIDGAGWLSLRDRDRFKVCDTEFRVFDPRTPDADSGSCSIVNSQVAEHHEHSQSLSLSSLSKSLTGENNQLFSLIRLALSLRDVLQIEEVLTRAVSILLEIFPRADRVAIALVEQGHVQPKWWKLRSGDPSSKIQISSTLVAHVLKSCEAIISRNARADFEDVESIQQLDVNTVMCAPLFDSTGTAHGVVYLDSQQGNQLSRLDLDVLAAIATQLSLAINFARLHEIAIQDALVRRDVESARSIQLQHLPSETPRLDGFELAGFYRAARHIGGDYYDYVPLPDGRWAIVVGDVVGKGVPAALTMVRLAIEARTALEVCGNAAAALNRLNLRLTNSFITLVIVLVEPGSGKIEIGNAGHELPMLHRADGSFELIGADVACCPIGVMEKESYVDIKFELEPGDSLTLYSDGFPDAESPMQSRFGRVRLESAVAAAPRNGTEAVPYIVNEVDRFMGKHPQFDDMCLVQIRRVAT